ncbi:MAG: dTMP kinase [Phycisphaeraceae bacterium]|nr:dTMP kinase [Phycisphaeraceae bacterium]
MTTTVPPWLSRLRKRFIVFDGPDGSGKSTQFQRFSKFVQNAGIEVCEVREPGGTHIGEQIRRVLLDPANKEEVDLRCEMLLFMASRAQLVAQRIRPARNAGQMVLADRFISSTLAYQGSAGGLPISDILETGRIALGDCWPDLTVVFDVDEETALARMNPLLRQREFDTAHDRMELKGADFHRTVRQGYLDQAKNDSSRYLVVDARGDADSVYALLLKGIESKMK